MSLQLITVVQEGHVPSPLYHSGATGIDIILCGTGILPVQENKAKCKFQPILYYQFLCPMPHAPCPITILSTVHLD